MGSCVATGEICEPSAVNQECCLDWQATCHTRPDEDSNKRCYLSEVGVRKEATLGTPNRRASRLRPEKGVSGLLSCMDDDAGLVGLAKENDFNDVTGCADVPGNYCTNSKVVTLCPVTCAAQSGCDGTRTLALDSARTLEATRALAAKASMRTEAIATGDDLSEFFIMALAVVGSITVVVKAFTSCTRKREYKAVLDDKKIEQPEEI